jgi:hypothetical protein
MTYPCHNVPDPLSRLRGTNRITRAYGGCVLHEQYDTGRGYSGASYNIYDAGRRKWHQSWVDTSGTLLRLDGGLVEGKMVLEGEAMGAPTARRSSTESPGLPTPTAAFGSSGNRRTPLANGPWPSTARTPRSQPSEL